jgi:hypothetical protein
MVRTKRRSQRQRSHRGGGGSLFGTDNYGEGKTLMRSAFDTVSEHGSRLTNAVGNKVGDWLKKQPVIREEKEESMGNRGDTDSDDKERRWLRPVGNIKKKTYKGYLRGDFRGGRSKKRGKRTRRKTKRRRH